MKASRRLQLIRPEREYFYQPDPFLLCFTHVLVTAPNDQTNASARSLDSAGARGSCA